MADLALPESSTAELAAVHGFLAQFADDRARGEVRTLADYQARFPGHATVIAAEFAALTAEPETAGEPARVGPYRLLHELGRGGQATVWLAHDTRLPRQVALKVLRRGPSTQERELRLRREAEATARLDDPGICQVYEIGQDQGDAWIAMRYVAGLTLAEHIRRWKERADQRSTTSFAGTDTTHAARAGEVIALFERIARSVHRAHTCGIVHRDLKPGNIMVADDGAPVVLDFGLAHEDSDAPSLTRPGDVFGTPAYMAPEQVLGGGHRADARCDVYSLGVSLYEALTLRRPFDAPTHEAMFTQILRGDAPSVRRLNPTVPRDVAVVVATAMEREAARRYHSALEFAEDLRRVRAHEPIRARPPGVWRRAVQFTRRHRAAAAVFVALAVGLGASLVQAVRAARARQEAQAQADVARAVNRYLVEVFGKANPAVNPLGRTMTAPELLQLAAQSVEDTLREQPRSLAAVQATLGQANTALGEYARAGEQLQRALALRRQLEGGAGTELIDSLLALANLHTLANDFAAAEQALREAARRGAWSKDDDSEQHMTFLHEEMGLATTRGDARTARGFALELLGVLARKRPPSDRKVIQARLALGAIETQLGDFAAADATFAACRVHLGDSADELRVNLALNEAALRWHQGHKAQAAAGFKEALAVQRKLCGDENNLVANLLINLGVVSRHMGERDEARRCYEEALAMLRKLHGDDHTMVAITRTNLGRVLEDVGQLAAAIEMHRAALATHRKLGGEQSQDYLTCLHNLAGALLMHGAVAEARERFTDLVRRRREVLGDQHIDVADSLVGLARATAKSDPAAAEPSYRQAHAIYAAAVGAADVRTLDAELGLLEVLIARGGDAMAQAEQLGVALYARATTALPATAPIPTAVARALAQLYSGTDRASQAEAWQQRAR